MEGCHDKASVASTGHILKYDRKPRDYRIGGKKPPQQTAIRIRGRDRSDARAVPGQTRTYRNSHHL